MPICIPDEQTVVKPDAVWDMFQRIHDAKHSARHRYSRYPGKITRLIEALDEIKTQLSVKQLSESDFAKIKIQFLQVSKKYFGTIH